MHMSEKTGVLGTITKIVFIGGAIIIFIILAIWIIRWIPNAISGLGNVGSTISNELRGGELIQLKTKKN